MPTDDLRREAEEWDHRDGDNDCGHSPHRYEKRECGRCGYLAGHAAGDAKGYRRGWKAGLKQSWMAASGWDDAQLAISDLPDEPTEE